ncbi:HDIG domain-containing protein [Palleniella muris]|uniref:HDIG domain-containing protein n=1 Tax=Palleniella muris TaxID=3038145 RepID=A0AC61QLZ3_9BACT|nr:HDIG domain-containing metalloprotein [Palleniella muris]TGX80038.1 HDIG domain-containing protein [Palleniella muris]
MAKSYTQSGMFWKNLLKRSWLIVVTTVLVVLIMPHDPGVSFVYELNHPWHYDQLIAETEIPIYKSEEVLKQERDSLLQGFEPYYSVSVTVRERALKKFNEEFRDGIHGLSRSYSAYVAKRIRMAYDMGIINADVAQSAADDSTRSIRLVSGNTATSVPVHRFMTPLTAYEWLFHDPAMQKQRQALQQCNLNEFLEPNILLDKDRTEMEMNDLLSSIPTASGIIQVGEEIINRGVVVDEKAYAAITSYIREYQKQKATHAEILTTYGGQALFVFIVIALFTLYLLLYRSDYFEKTSSYVMLYTIIIILTGIVSLVMRHRFFSVYVIPLCMAPMFVRVFLDSRTAFITHAVVVMLSALAVQKQFDFIAIELAGGLAAIYTLRELSHRSQVFTAALTVVTTEFLVFVSLQLIEAKGVADINLGLFPHFVANAVLLLLAYPLMFVVEKAFGFVSAVTLFELSDTNKAVLRHLSEVAPGTFQHSIMVSNLASAIASRIGARALLVRVGGLYHDIGKMRHPVFYTENQASINPHTRISEQESAQVIISHVTEGLRLADKEGLPGVIQDFIRTHHGNGLVSYFYVQYKNKHPDEEVDETIFRYPGPNPFTREQAILMMADSVEAASRSLKEYTEESIAGLVDKIIDSQVQNGFFHDCPITFRDIQTAKDVLIERLKAIYHTRIAYPELHAPKEDED